MIKTMLVLALSFASLNAFAEADEGDQSAVDKCISHWTDSPFKKGHDKFKKISATVNVMGIGGKVNDDEKTDSPQLVLISPSVNVLGKSTVKLLNPNGWYCFKPTTSVLGKLQIEAHCKAHIASTSEGANVLGGTDHAQGVTVLGTVRIKTVGCEEKKTN